MNKNNLKLIVLSIVTITSMLSFSGCGSSHDYTPDVNTAPEATFTTLNTYEDTTKFATLTASDEENASIKYRLISKPSHGSLELRENGEFSYSPSSNYYGEDSFVYVANDYSLDSEEQTVLITVNSINDTPSIDSIFEDKIMDLDVRNFTIYLNISDVEGDELSLDINTSSKYLTITPNFDKTLVQGNYENISLDFNISVELNVSALAKVIITLDDGHKNVSKSFYVSIKLLTHNGTKYYAITSPHTGKFWLDRNLGASKVCSKYNEKDCYGEYYQWGRGYDGHQESNSTTIATQESNISNTSSKFVLIENNVTLDWLAEGIDNNGSIRSNNWSKLDGSSICPIGFRVPSIKELKDETIDLVDGWAVENTVDAFENFLRLPATGNRYRTTGDIIGVAESKYLSNTISDISENYPNFNLLEFNHASSIVTTFTQSKEFSGFPVRCIKN